MKDTKFLVILFSFVFAIMQLGYSQNHGDDGNPFARYGTKVPVFTFSGGTEFHDCQRVVEIGSVKYDTRTHKVVGFIHTNDTANCLPPEVTAMQPDPKAEKYYSISPYAYCLNNPVRFTDPDGRDVKPGNQDAFRMIQNTLTNKGLNYVRLDKNGYIDKGLLNSHTSESGNFNALSTLVNSELDVHVNLGTSYTYKDANGNIKESNTMSYFGPDAEFMDTDFNQVSGITTGESGFMGKTLLPGKGTSGENSIGDSKIDIIVNGNLSETGRAEIYSHEANGHAVMYVNTKDRIQSGHQGSNWVDTNLPLTKRILDSRRETVTNMRNK